VRVNITMPGNLLRRLDKLAEERGMNRSRTLQELVSEKVGA